MMTQITRPQADALAALVHAMRQEWDVAGIVRALWDARDRGSAFELAIAAIHCASDLTNRTPAVIALAGVHWTKGKALGMTGGGNFVRCPQPGHTSFPAHNCGACRMDALDSSEASYERTPPVPTERVREILATALPRVTGSSEGEAR